MTRTQALSPALVRALRLALLLATLLGAPAPASAHECGPPLITLNVGEACAWRIIADRSETLSTYTPFAQPNPSITEITPSRPFAARDGNFVIRGLAPGTNVFTVFWHYPGTGFSGVCTVTIHVVQPPPGQVTYQTRQADGLLCVAQGREITTQALRTLIDLCIPGVSPKLLVMSQCFAGNIAQSGFFKAMPNAAIMTGSSPNQEGRYGGFDDDAARALKPGPGKTAEDVLEAGSVGRHTLFLADDGTVDPKETVFMASEFPTRAGSIPLSSYSLASTTANSNILSRHVVVYAGRPSSNAPKLEVVGTTTYPSPHGKKTPTTDNAVRDTLIANFAGEPNTTVTTAGGAPPEDGPTTAGQDGWEFSGTLEGLKAALRKAGDAIRSSADPAREQFILFIGDHGVLGNAGNPTTPPRPVTPNSKSVIRTGFETFSSDEPAAFYMEQDRYNQPGFSVLVLPIAPPGSSTSPIAATPPGSFELSVLPGMDAPLRLDHFEAAPVDLDGDGRLGSLPGEGYSVFFPVDESLFLHALAGIPVDISLLHRMPTDLKVESLLQLTGAIEREWSSHPRPVLTLTRSAPDLELRVRGRPGLSYTLEASTTFNDWRPLETFKASTPVMTRRLPEPRTPQFYRVSVIEP